MSKSYLIIDTPRSCDFCPVGSEAPWCPVAPEGADIDQQNIKYKRPDWCPLRKDHEVIDKNRQLEIDLANEWTWRESFYDELVAFRDELGDLDRKLGELAIRGASAEAFWEECAEDSIRNCRESADTLIDWIIEYGNS